MPSEEATRRIDEHSEAAPARSDERRRLLRAALTAAPVLMTIASKPVLGHACVTASATSAGSSAAHVVSMCSGLTPSQWKARVTEWPAPYYATTHQSLDAHPATLFHCPTTGLGGSTYGDRTMLEVIDVAEGGAGISSLGRYIVAALLNARSGRTPVLTEAGVRMMWNSTINDGYYEATAGIRWSAAQCIAYLKTTMS
jgi:hypothetical protein